MLLRVSSLKQKVKESFDTDSHFRVFWDGIETVLNKYMNDVFPAI